MTEPAEIVTRTARTRLEAGDIIHAIVLPGAVQTLTDAVENMQAIHTLLQGKRCSLIIDIRQIRSQERAAREYYTKPENAKILRAVAIIIGSPISQVIGNFFIGFGRVNVPSRLFTSEAEAREWLNEFADS